MERKAPRVAAIIPAGGRGIRLGGGLPKQFMHLRGRMILERSIQAFESSKDIHEIIVVVPPTHLTRARSIIRKSKFKKVSAVVKGGKQRQESVWNGLKAVTVRPDIVLVHDAVRPLVTGEAISRVVLEALVHRAAALGVPVKDTIKIEGKRGYYVKTLERSKLWAVQTPQGFHFDLLMKAHQTARRKGLLGTDEAMLVEKLGIPVRIVQGDYRNLKITTVEDLMTAGLLLRA